MAKLMLPAVFLLAVFIQPALRDTAESAQTPASRPVLVEFLSRVESYAALRRAVAQNAPPTTIPTVDVAQILETRAQFVDGLRSARAESVKGEIFTPAIEAEFRRLLFLELGGTEGLAALKHMRDDAPAEFVLGVNVSYPADEPRGAMSAGVLQQLPTLPARLEYRFVGPHLLLFDVDGNIIVDFITDAIPRSLLPSRGANLILDVESEALAF